MTNDLPGPIVPPAREGCRRTFSEADKRRIVEETARPGASLSEVARHYGIAARVLFRWKQELTQMAPLFVAVEIAGATQPPQGHTSISCFLGGWRVTSPLALAALASRPRRAPYSRRRR